MMGSQSIDDRLPNFDPDAKPGWSPVHPVRVAPIFLSMYKMTQGQWLRVMGTNPSSFRPDTSQDMTLLHPVESVSYDAAVVTLRRIWMILSTDAQWEYPSRAGTSTSFSTGKFLWRLFGPTNIADECAHEVSELPRERGYLDGFPLHAPVGNLYQNAVGLHDMHGNVWEWRQDGDYGYTQKPRDAETPGSTAGDFRVFRGGEFSRPAAGAKSAYRGGAPHGYHGHNIGLRPARALER